MVIAKNKAVKNKKRIFNTTPLCVDYKKLCGAMQENEFGYF
jgi:hypothetical protein